MAIRQPLGVFGIIGPFNFPFMVPLWFAPFAVATGNCIVVKPSSEDPISQIKIVELAEEAGVPLYPDPEMAIILSQIPLGEEIPDNLYKAIAEVIAFAYILAGKVPEGFVPNPPSANERGSG